MKRRYNIINFTDLFKSKVSYHENRVDSRRASKDQKNFSDGYITGVYMIETYQGSDGASANARRAHALIKDPNAEESTRQQAKGLIASLYDYKKTIPSDLDVWGRKMKNTKKRDK